MILVQVLIRIIREKKEDDDFKVTDEQAMLDPKKKTPLRTLRIREDTAKYLRNLNLDSAFYEPKSRSMRENPNPEEKEDTQVYKGDNFFRNQGQVLEFQKLQKFAWSGVDKVGLKNTPFNPAANPSQTELIFKQLQQKTQEAKEQKKENLTAIYGSQDQFKADPNSIPKETEEFTLYSPEGGQVKKPGITTVSIPSSKYPEDVLLGNHTKIWGSYWENGKWGYGCCHQFEKKSYCTGKSGINAKEDIEKQTIEERQKIFDRAKKMKEEVSKSTTLPSGKRPYTANEIDEEEYETWRKEKRMKTDDPMFKELNKK